MSDVVNKDVELEKFVLDVVDKKVVDFRAEDSIVDANVSQTIEGASTITITLHDQKRNVLRAAILQSKDDRLRAVDAKLDGFWWRLVKVGKTGDDLTLTFEEREVAYLRGHKGPRKAARDKLTRAQFVLLLVKRVKKQKIKTVIPELKVAQPIGDGYADDVRKQLKPGKTRVETKAKRDESRSKGFADGVKLRGKEGTLTKEQLKNADIVLQVCEDKKAGAKATLAAVEACIIEAPDFKNPVGGEGTSSGILQLTNIHKTDRRDVANVVGIFLTRGFTGKGGAIKLAAANPGRSAGWVAQEVQGSGHPERYDTVRSQAKAIIDAWGGSGGGGTGNVRYKKYEFKVAKGETYWTAIQRLADEVKWRAFVVKGKFYFISEERLYKGRSQYYVSESTPGVDNIDFDWDTGKKVGSLKITCRIDRWKAAPGTVITVEDMGPANGRWLVVQIDRSLFSPVATITLNKAMSPLAEPLGEEISEQSENSGGDSGTGLGDLKGNAGERALAATRAIGSKRYPYVWGGGHGKAGVPSSGKAGSNGAGPTIGPGYDCSGGAAAALKAAGIIPSSWNNGVPGSGTMASSYGVAGEGESLTLWANGGHVFLEAKVDGKTYHLGTGRFGKDWSGFGVNPQLHTHSGFTPRHWPGT